ncbi:MAG: flavin reductase family protein [Candidatus Sumerlaeota bacterium]|nr:flavin reductase family protein [Candidatus Sumerlaeota bacterium]
MQKKVSYEEAIGLKYPEQVVILLVKDAEGKCDPVAIGWTMVASAQPPMMAVALGKTRYSLEAVRRKREFVIAFPAAAQAGDALFFGSRSGRDTDKLAERHAKTLPATAIDGVLLEDALANFECKLESETPTGDHVVVIGRVVASHRNADADGSRLYTLGDGTMGGVKKA